MRIVLISVPTTTASRNDARFPAPSDALDGGARADLAAMSFAVPPDASVVVGPSAAACETASLLGCGAARVEAALSDVDYGRWAGRTLAEIAADEPDAVTAWLRDPASAPHGGESVTALVERAHEWLYGCDVRYDVVAIAHAAVVRAVLVTVLGASIDVFARIDVEPLRRAECTFDGARFHMRLLNGPL
jgi:broad specificity phosphatase PhoE